METNLSFLKLQVAQHDTKADRTTHFLKKEEVLPRTARAGRVGQDVHVDFTRY